MLGKKFLQQLELFINSRLPAGPAMRAEVTALVKEAKASTDKRQKYRQSASSQPRLIALGLVASVNLTSPVVSGELSIDGTTCPASWC